jgi:hypothetical protein
MIECRCASGGKSACLLKERIRTLGNDLARAPQACRAGDQTAWQTVARARTLQNSVQQGAATPNQQPGSVTRNPYDWRTYERGPIGNPYDWRNYPEYDASRSIGNPYDWRNYERDIVIGNPYDWRNYGKIK